MIILFGVILTVVLAYVAASFMTSNEYFGTLAMIISFYAYQELVNKPLKKP